LAEIAPTAGTTVSLTGTGPVRRGGNSYLGNDAIAAA
jgi:hypothetical protein